MQHEVMTGQHVCTSLQFLFAQNVRVQMVRMMDSAFSTINATRFSEWRLSQLSNTLLHNGCAQFSHHYPTHTSLNLRVDRHRLQLTASILIIHTLQRCPGQSTHIVVLLSHYLEMHSLPRLTRVALRILGRSKGSTKMAAIHLSLCDGVCAAHSSFSDILQSTKPDGINGTATHKMRCPQVCLKFRPRTWSHNHSSLHQEPCFLKLFALCHPSSSTL